MSKKADRRILFIQGHPDEGSFGAALETAYVDGAHAAGYAVDVLRVRELNFNPNLIHGYRERMELEPDLVAAQERIGAADHIVLCYPVWWGSTPALLKGFFDRTLLPHFGFTYKPGAFLQSKLLTGKTAHLICTMDSPWFWDFFVYHRSAYQQVKRATLEFCGISVRRSTTFYSLKNKNAEEHHAMLLKIKRLGEKGL